MLIITIDAILKAIWSFKQPNIQVNMVADSDLPELLCRVNFPLYNVNLVSPRHIMLGGGGGAAKTGVQNGFVS